MAEVSGENISRGIYRTRDKISNFRLRVRVRRARTTADSATGTGSQLSLGGSTDSVRSGSSTGEASGNPETSAANAGLLDDVN